MEESGASKPGSERVGSEDLDALVSSFMDAACLEDLPELQENAVSRRTSSRAGQSTLSPASSLEAIGPSEDGTEPNSRATSADCRAYSPRALAPSHNQEPFPGSDALHFAAQQSLTLEQAVQLAAVAALAGPPVDHQNPPAPLANPPPQPVFGVPSPASSAAPARRRIEQPPSPWAHAGARKHASQAGDGHPEPQVDPQLPFPFAFGSPLPASARSSFNFSSVRLSTGDISEARVSLRQSSSDLVQLGPPALVSDSSGQEYIVQPVKWSADAREASLPTINSAEAMPILSSLPSGQGVDRSSSPAEHGIQSTINSTVASRIHFDHQHSGNSGSGHHMHSPFDARSSSRGGGGAAYPGGPRSASTRPQQASSYHDAVDVRQLYMEGLLLTGSPSEVATVRASLPVEFELRQALMQGGGSGGGLLADSDDQGHAGRQGSRSSDDVAQLREAETAFHAGGNIEQSFFSPFGAAAGAAVHSPTSEEPSPLARLVASEPSLETPAALLSPPHDAPAVASNRRRRSLVHAANSARAAARHHKARSSLDPHGASIERPPSANSLLSILNSGSYSYASGHSDDLDGWEIGPEELELGQRIGIGSFGEVFRGQWRQTDVAIKRFLDQDIGHRLVQGFVKEVAIMKRLHHPNVVQFMGACTQPPNLCIVTQYVPRGSLFKLLHRTSYVPDNRRRLRMALDVARGMNYLHTCRPPVIHRDLKSPNLLVDTDMTVKVCDFGLSQVKSSNVLSAKTQAGTPEWTAPEVLQGGACSEASDVYAFGVIVWELLTGEEPWVDKTAMQVVGAVGFSGELLDIPADASPAMKDLLQRCFGSPENRPQFSEIIPLLKRQLVQLQAATRKQGSAESVTTSETLDEVRD